MKRVVIVGGGYAGTLLARALDPIAEVVLVEPKAAFVHNVAAIRAVVDPAWLDKLILPYEHLLKRGRVLRDRVIAIEGDGVRLAANGSLEGDILVVATGSKYAQPFKASGDSISDFRSALLDAHEKLKAARSVAIVGAGAVGVELAGEIATGMSGKQIDLVSATAVLFPDFTAALGRRLGAELARMNVSVHLGATAEGLRETMRPTSGPLAIPGRSSFAADLIFPVMGAKPDNALRPNSRHRATAAKATAPPRRQKATWSERSLRGECGQLLGRHIIRQFEANSKSVFTLIEFKATAELVSNTSHEAQARAASSVGVQSYGEARAIIRYLYVHARIAC